MKKNKKLKNVINMAHCVNRSSKEFIALAEQTNINPMVLAAKISLWQETNGLDNFPTLGELNIVSQITSIDKIKGNKTQALLSFLEEYGFDVQESEELLINLASKRIDLNSSDITQVAKAISGPLAEMLSYSDTFYEIEKAVVDTKRFKDLYSDLLDEYTDSTKRNLKRLATKQIFKELLEKGFTEELAADLNIDKTLWDKLVDFVATVINRLKDADWDVIDKNISKVVEKTFKGEDYIRLTKKEGYKQVDFQQAFDENDIAKDIMTKIGTNSNIVLTGSIAYATQGTVYRKIETVVHDLDFVNKGLSEEQVESLVTENYPDAIKAYSFFDKYKVDTYLIPPAGFKISNIQRRETGKITAYEVLNEKDEVVGTYNLKYDVSSTGKTINESEEKSGVEAMLVDFFSQDTIDRGTVEQDFIGSDGITHKVQLSKFEAPFEAKLTYSRFKDIWDYNRFIPNKETQEKEDYALPVNPNIIKHSAYSQEEFNAFRNSYHSKEDLKLAADVISKKLDDAIGYTALSYEVQKGKSGLIESVIVNPTSKNNFETAVDNITITVAKRMYDTVNPSLAEGFIKIVGQVDNRFRNNIKVTYSNDLLQAFAEGMQNYSLEEFQSYMYERFLESKGIYESQIKTGQDAREELEHLKNLPHSQFQGFYNSNTGEIYTSIEQWKSFLNEIVQYDEMSELEEEEDNALTINNPTSSIYIDPTYEYYKVKRQEQLTKIQKQIDKLKAKERLEGTNPSLSGRMAYLKSVKTNLEKDLLDLKNTTNYFETVRSLLYKDINLIRDLIRTPNIENFFLAEDISNFIKINLNFNNPSSQLFKTEEGKKFDTKVDNLIKEVSHLNSNLVSEIIEARNVHFIEILGKYENNIKKLYPSKTLEEIKDILLKNLADIGGVEANLLSQGKNLVSESDIVGELMRLEYDIQVEKEKPRVQRLIKKINTLVPRVEAELRKLGHVTIVGTGVEGVSKFSFYNYQSLFYRKDDKGNPMPTLVSKFSQKWDKFIKNFNYEIDDKIFEARYAKDWVKVETLLREKYYKLNANVDFVDFRKLENVANFSTDPTLKKMFSTNTAENQLYKDTLIKEVGLPEYNNIVKQQISHLQSFLSKEAELLEAARKKENVNSYADLSAFSKQNILITLKRYNPEEFLKSKENGKQGLIEYTLGTQQNEKYGYLEYNTYYPKKDNYDNMSTEYYDKDYETIENNPVLKEFWPVMEEALYQINDSLIDSNLKLDSKTILHMSKGIIENAVDKGFYETVKGIPSKETVLNTVQHLKNTFSVKDQIKNKEQEVQLPATINSFRNIVEQDFEISRMQLSNILQTTLNDASQINWNALSDTLKEQIYETLGINNEQDFLKQITLSKTGTFKIGSLRIFNRIAVMEQQTADLPLLVKALLEQSVLHKARVAAKENIDILRGVRENILNREGKSSEELNNRNRTTGKIRTNAQARDDYFYENVVLNESEPKSFGSISKLKDKNTYEKKYANGDLIEPDEMFKYLLNFHHKNFSPEEKVQYRVMKKRWDFVTNALENPSLSTEQKKELLNEKNSIEQRITLMGKDYMASTLISNLLNKGLAIGIGLGYATLGMVYNYLNSRSNFFHRDGEFWKEGNAYPAFAFVDMHISRRVNPAYATQWKVMEAFVHQLDLVQDGTNDLQKAKKTGITESPKILNLKRWVQNPLYGTELVEWYNQIPVMLAMGADLEITNPTTGEIVSLFNGTGFPAHEVDKTTGQLKLKDEFRTPENIRDYENFDSDKMALWKVQVSRAIQSLNGDYSVSGVIKAKGNVAAQTLLLFKTWAGEYYHSRWAYDQKSVAFGKTKDGFISGSLMDKRTRGMAGSMLIGNLATGALMTPMLNYGIGLAALSGFGGLAITGGIAAGLYYKNRKSLGARMAQQAVPSQISLKETMAYILKATTVGTLEIPINKAWNVIRLIGGSYTGTVPGPKTLINIDSTFNGKLDEKAATNLRNMTRMFQKSNTATLIAILTQLFLGSDDDEETEKRGKEGSEQEKKYIAQQEKREKKAFIFHAIKNINQREYDEMNLGHNIVSSLNMVAGDDSTVLGPVEGLSKAAAQAYMGQDGERYSKPGSMYHGDTKSSVFLRKAFLPQMFRNIGKEEWKAGFEIAGNEEYQKNDKIDTMFESDMKKERKEQKQKRADIKLTTQDEQAIENFGKNYNDLTIEEQVKVDRKVNRALRKNKEYKFKDRSAYNEDQDSLNPDED